MVEQTPNLQQEPATSSRAAGSCVVPSTRMPSLPMLQYLPQNGVHGDRPPQEMSPHKQQGCLSPLNIQRDCFNKMPLSKTEASLQTQDSLSLADFSKKATVSSKSRVSFPETICSRKTTGLQSRARAWSRHASTAALHALQQ